MAETSEVFSLGGDFSQAIAAGHAWAEETSKATERVRGKFVSLQMDMDKLSKTSIPTGKFDPMISGLNKMQEAAKKTREAFEKMDMGLLSTASAKPGGPNMVEMMTNYQLAQKRAADGADELATSQRRMNTLMVQGAAVIDDFSSQVLTAGFGPALRATTNNLSFMASQFGGAMALWGTGAAVLGSLLIPLIGKWAFGTEEAAKATEKANEQQRKLAESHKLVLDRMKENQEFADKVKFGDKGFQARQELAKADERRQAAMARVAAAGMALRKMEREQAIAGDIQEPGLAFHPGVEQRLLDAKRENDEAIRELRTLDATERARRSAAAGQELRELGTGISKRFMEGFRGGAQKERPTKRLFEAEQASDDAARSLLNLSIQEGRQMMGVKPGSGRAAQIRRDFDAQEAPFKEAKKQADLIVSEEKSIAETAKRQRDEQTETLKMILEALGGGAKRAVKAVIPVGHPAPLE